MVSRPNSKYSSFDVTSVPPVVTPPFEPHDPVPVGEIVLSLLLNIGTRPTPAAAVAVTLAVVAAGAVVLMPVGKFQRASVNPQSPVPALVVVSARSAVAWWPVSCASMNRLFETLW